MEDAQASKREKHGEKRKETKEDGPSKKARPDFKDKKPSWQRINVVYTSLTVSITQALMAVEGKGVLSHPKFFKDDPHRPKSDKLCCFHNDYGHTTKECRHLKNEIERLVQNGHMQEYICWKKAHGTGPYQMVIRMIVGGPTEGDSQRTRKAQIRDAHGVTMKEVMDVEALDDTPLFSLDEQNDLGPNSADILFGEAYDQMRLGDIPLEVVDTSLYGFAGEVVVISTNHMKIKFPVTGGVGEVQADPLQSRKRYIEAIKKDRKRGLEETQGEDTQRKRGKDPVSDKEPKDEGDIPANVQPIEELLTIELVP
ncbi:UNVERIFIED_CONTAM: hypothetical protein Slati_3520300 [Sesamum latifolium]|uniref:Reverse transcriptase domain-containing protein n=1 Tax=Sesamum latifolium TaxID=2727402 RepID=A0AAW2UIR5_9LAMI